jgi:hypothetical protein
LGKFLSVSSRDKLLSRTTIMSVPMLLHQPLTSKKQLIAMLETQSQVRELLSRVNTGFRVLSSLNLQCTGNTIVL